jgi:predicted P-loop ATPase
MIKIAIGNSRMDKKWKNIEMTWEEFVSRISTTKRTTETVEEYRKLKKGKQDSIKDVGGFVGGHLKEGRRKNGYVNERSLLTLDMDYGEPGIWDEIKMLHPFKCAVYSTHKHTPEKPRLRLIIPMSRTISEDEYPAVPRMVAKDIGIDLFDDTTYEPARLMYWASTSANGEFFFDHKDGEVLNPDDYLSRYKDWRDVTSWAMSSRQSEIVKRSMTKQADPLDKDGAVGAFCRTYTIDEAINTFLADVYAPSAMDGRYDYIPADSSAGVCIYEGKFAFSHHATDPASGRLLNAFDLVRLHLFGSRDLDCKEDTPSTKLPSYKAMQELVVNDEAVKLTLADERKRSAATDFAPADDWESELELDKQGRIKDTVTNISIIITNDEAFKNIVFNQHKGMIDVIGELPWNQVKPGWGEPDMANAKIYFERKYGIWSPTKFKDALLGVVSTHRLYHPLKEYLSGLEWDGTPRIETLLIDYLGADDTPYVRAVSKLTLCAAVARVFEPGIKYDFLLVLVGPQGIGKSTIFEKLGRKWYSDSLTIADMKDKTAAEKLVGYWIMELGELAGIKKMDVETVKSFITRTDDKFRQSYGTVVESHPRACIIVGSTNSEDGFLRDISGNRRFLPVNVSANSKQHPWDLNDEIVGQLWAEAKVLYENGEPLYLKGKLAEMAQERQKAAMEYDPRQGIVEEYLNKLLPEDWDRMDLFQRRAFLYGTDFDGGIKEGTVKRERVCTLEIWCECFGKQRENIKKSDSYEIESIMQRIDGWQKYTGNKSGKIRFSDYGIQKGYVRVADK